MSTVNTTTTTLDVMTPEELHELTKNAKKCLAAGLSITPIGQNKQPVKGLPWKQWETTLMTDTEVDAIFTSRDDLEGFAIIGGSVSGNLEMIDIDDADTCSAYLAELNARVPNRMKTLPQVRTPKGGLHIYYRHKMEPRGNKKLAMRCRDGKQSVLIETRGQGGYVVSPFSRAACHPLHKRYELVNGDIFDIPVIEDHERACLWSFAKAFNEVADKTTLVAAPRSVTTYTTNDNHQANRPGDDFNARGQWGDILEPLGWTACYVRGDVTHWTRPGKSTAHGPSATTNMNGKDLMYCFSTNADPLESEKWYTKYAAYTVLCHHGDWSKSASALAAQGYGDKLTDSLLQDPADATVGLTDTGNAARLARRHGNDIRYVRGDGDAGDWYVWDGKRWARDNTGEVYRKAKDTVLSIYAEAAQEQDDERRKRIRQHAGRSESDHAISAMIHLARSEQGIAVSSKVLDCDPWLFNCENGTIDLKTGASRPAERMDYITKVAPVQYDPAATCARWEQFMLEVMGSNAELVTYLQRLLGMGLTGDIREHILPVMWGEGRNGKNTMLDAVMSIMGDGYTCPAPDTLLTSKSGNEHPTDKAGLWGMRLVVASETDEGDKLRSAQVKNLTGDAFIRARYMRQDYFTFKRTHKTILMTNHRPQISDRSEAIWQRVKLIPFTRQFIGTDADTTLADKLKAEYPGILDWLLRGCLDWQKQGLQEPAIVSQATKQYRADEDTFAVFVDECCIVADDARVSRRDIRCEYSDWARRSGERDLKPTVLYDRLAKAGYTPIKWGGLRGFRGIKIDDAKITDGLKSSPFDD